MKNILKIQLLLIIIVGLLGTFRVMSEEKTPMKCLSFETDVEGQSLKYVDGINGRGVLCSPEAPLFKLPVKDYISLDKGTISLWIKPINWNGSSKEGYCIISLFDSSAIGIGGWAKHHLTPTLGISLYLSAKDTWLGFGSNPKPLQNLTKNTWHNVVFTFSQEQFAIYLDAVRVGGCTGETAKELWQRLQQACYFQVGGTYAGTDFCSVIDELTTYDVVLSEEEISQAFKKIIIKNLN